MDIDSWPNLAAMFFDQVARRGDRPFLWKKREGAYRPLSWGDTAARVTPLARGLMRLGVGVGDRVVLVSENRPAWLVADLAIMSIGAITVPAYVTNTEDDHRHVLQDSGAKVAIVSTRRLAQRVIAAAHRVADTGYVVAMDPPEIHQRLDVEVMHLDHLVGMGRDGHDNVVEMARTWARDDIACIIYTSGTGGLPKGVMLSHGAILHNCAGAADALRELGLGDEVFLSFLPLSHSYEHTNGQFFPIAIGAEIYYADGVETLAANLIEARPTLMTAVPRLYELFHARMTAAIRKKGGLGQRMFERAVELGRRRLAGERLGAWERLQDMALERLVRGRVRARFGGRLKALVSGGAPLNPEIGTFFTALGLRILQGYGQTETAPTVSVNRPGRVKMHTVGPPLKGVEVRIAEDGEILVRGPLAMRGYWRNDEATRATLVDGWVHTGDIGVIDADGHLEITDRKKDIIVNSGGDNIAPQRVESILCLQPEVAQAMVHGDRRPHLVALVVPDAEWLATWAAAQGRSGGLARLADDPDLHKALAPAIERANARLSAIEKVRRFVVASQPFSTENGQLTPTLKVRRHVLRQVYGEALEALYG